MRLWAELISLILCVLFSFYSPVEGVKAEKQQREWKWELTVAAIFQDEAPYLQEWIEFHQMVVIEHFWLYNNDSSDNFFQVLEPYIASGLVDLIDWPSMNHDFHNHCFVTQPAAYLNAVAKAQTTSHWLALIDIDEFLFSPTVENVADILNKEFPHASGVGVNWQCFGTSFLAELPTDRCMIETLLYKAEVNAPENFYIKSIVNPRDVINCINPHFCLYRPGCFHENTLHEPFLMDNPHVSIDLLRINHYWAKGQKYLDTVKIPQYRDWGRLNSFMERIKGMNAVYDDAICRFLPGLRARLHLKPPRPEGPKHSPKDSKIARRAQT